jgi:hypothetical protein
MDSDENTPKNSRQESSSTTGTPSPPDWWSWNPTRFKTTSPPVTETSSPPDCWSWNSNESGEVSSSATETSSESDLGKWTLIRTDDTGLQCGLLALISSITHQTDWIRVPSMEELSTIALTGRIGEFVQALNEIGTEEEWDRNFTEDHLDAVLQEYGLSEGVNVCLGVHHAHDGWRTVFGRNAPNGNSDLYVIWVHHDGADAYSTTSTGERILGHYSGMKYSE